MSMIYTVRNNDTLTRIAKDHNTTVEELVKLNKITDPDKIKKGQILKLADDKAETAQTKQAETQKEIDEKLEKINAQYEAMQKQMASGNAKDDINELELFGYGIGGAAAWKGAEYLAPKVKSAAETGYLKALYAKDDLKAGAQKLGEKVKQTAKHAAKKAELEYTFAKDGIKNRAKQTGNAVKNTVNTTKEAGINGTKSTASATKNTFAKSSKIMKLTKVGKAVSKRLPGVAQTVAVAEVAVAYNNGGTKAAAKQAVKSGSGLAMGAAGTKIGAAIGTAICPGVGTAIGAVVGGVAGYIAGEGLADKVLSWL